MTTPRQTSDAPENDIEQLRARLSELEGQVVQLKAKPAPSLDAESVLENATDGFVVYDAEFRFTYLNVDGERLLGKSKSELLGKTHWDAFPETIGSEIERQYRLALTERVAVIFESVYPIQNPRAQGGCSQIGLPNRCPVLWWTQAIKASMVVRDSTGSMPKIRQASSDN